MHGTVAPLEDPDEPDPDEEPWPDEEPPRIDPLELPEADMPPEADPELDPDAELPVCTPDDAVVP